MKETRIWLRRWLHLPAIWGRASRRQQQEMSLLLVVSLVFLPHIQSQPLWVSAGFASLLIWRAWQTWLGGSDTQTVVQRWLRYALLLLTSIGIWLTYRTLFGREPGTAFLFLLLALKLQEIRLQETHQAISANRPSSHLRDLYVVLFLCFFLILAGFFESQSIPTAFYLLMNVIAVVAALMFAHYGPNVPRVAVILKRAAWLCLQAIPLALVLFFVFPRAGGPLWGMPKEMKSARTGMSDSMSPGDIGGLLRSDAIAMRVQFGGKETPSLNQLRPQLYWRGPVLGEFDGRTWRPYSQENTQRAVDPQFGPPHFQIQIARTAPIYNYTATLEAQSQPWLFLLDVPSAMPRLENALGDIHINGDAVATHSLSPQQRLRYQATAVLSYAILPKESAVQRQDWLQLPAGFNPKTLQMAQDWKNAWVARHQGTPKPSDYQELVQQALRYFQQENFRYTLNPPLLGRQSVDDFLFQTRAGFCEHYSSAFVVLMRALDIPARVVNGYQGAELNPVDGTWNIRQSDAHAWAEVWFDEQGWRRIDPTAAVAPERVELGAEPLLQAEEPSFFSQGHLSWLGEQARHMRYQWEALNNRWNQWVLNYNKERQQSLLEKLGLPRLDWRSLSRYVLLILGLGMLLAAAWVLPPWRTLFNALRAARRREKDPVCQLYSGLEQAVLHYVAAQTRERATWERAPYEGWTTWGARISPALPPDWRQPLQQIISQCVALRYGKQLGEQAAETPQRQQELKKLQLWIAAFQQRIQANSTNGSANTTSSA